MKTYRRDARLTLLMRSSNPGSPGRYTLPHWPGAVCGGGGATGAGHGAKDGLRSMTARPATVSAASTASATTTRRLMGLNATRFGLLALLACGPLPAQDAFTSALETIKVTHETDVAAVQAATDAASLAAAQLATAQNQITALQGQITNLMTQIAGLEAEIARLNALLTPPPPPTAPDESLWPATETPIVQDYGDPDAYELGVKFRSSVAGNVKGVRFYKSAANTGTHVGHLWAATGGAALATVTFTGETASGWQEGAFAAPVAIQAGTLYVASVHMPAGHYAANVGYFQTARTLGSLTAPAASESANGVFKSGAAGFPDSSNANNANYWVDVVFSAGTASNPPPPSPIVVAWVGPTLNTDGTPCTDLAGYLVAWGAHVGEYGTPADVGMEISFLVPALPPVFVVVRAYDTSGNVGPWADPLEVRS